MYLEFHSARPTPIPVYGPGGRRTTVSRVPNGCPVELHSLHQGPDGELQAQSVVEARTVLNPRGGFVPQRIIDQVLERISAAIGPDYSLFGAHLVVLDPRDHLTDGSSVDLFKRNSNGGVWCTTELPAYPQDMASGWNYAAQIVVRSCFSDPNGPRQTRSILLPLEDLDLRVLPIRKLLMEAGLLSLEPGEIVERITLKVQQEEGSRVSRWGTTDTRRLDLDELPPVWLRTTEVASLTSRDALDLLTSTSVEADDGEPEEGVCVPGDHVEAAMV